MEDGRRKIEDRDRDRRLDLLPQEKLTAVVHLLQAISDPLAGPVTMGKKIAWTGPA